MPRHIEQPASRHSNPASMNTLSSPRRSASAFTCCEPGTTSARTRGLTCRPRATCAAASRSSIRALVQEPMKTRSRGMSWSAVPGFKSMYASARSATSRWAGVGMLAGSGTRSVTGRTISGLVPQDTNGASSSAWIWTVLSYVAPASVGNERQ